VQEWVSFFLRALIAQAEEDASKAWHILALYDQMKEQIANLTRSQFAIRALDVLFDHPIFSTPQFVARSGVPKGSAVRILGTLAGGEIVRVMRPGLRRRPAIYAFPRLIEIVNAPPAEAPPKVEPTVRTLDVVSHQ
jgi:hypothetical protein